MIEWLRQESTAPSEEYDTSNEIRQCAFDLAMLEGNLNAHTAAILLGLAKEAEFLLKSVKTGSLVSSDISMYIRSHGSNFLYRKYVELESSADPTQEVSDEMTSATEINQLTRGNTSSVSFGKNEMQEQFDQNITNEWNPIEYFYWPNVVDEKGDSPILDEKAE